MQPFYIYRHRYILLFLKNIIITDKEFENIFTSKDKNENLFGLTITKERLCQKPIEVPL